jgi:hypothetical protein
VVLELLASNRPGGGLEVGKAVAFVSADYEHGFDAGSFWERSRISKIGNGAFAVAVIDAIT